MKETPLEDKKYCFNGSQRSLLEFVESHKYRHCSIFDTEKQLEIAMKAAAIKDNAARELILEVLREAKYMAFLVEKMHEEFDALSKALGKANDEIKALMNKGEK